MPAGRRWNSFTVVLVLLALLVVGAMALAVALDGGGASDARLTDMFSKLFEMFSLGITFALVVLAINAFRLQADLERIKAESEREIEKLRDKQAQVDRVFGMIPKTINLVHDILFNLLTNTPPDETEADKRLPEEEKADRRAEVLARRTLPIYWRERALSLIMADTPAQMVSCCRDIIGTMEGADADIIERDILNVVFEALSEIAAASDYGLSEEERAALNDAKRDVNTLQRIAWEIEGRLPSFAFQVPVRAPSSFPSLDRNMFVAAFRGLRFTPLRRLTSSSIDRRG